MNERLETPSKIFIPKGSISKIVSHINIEMNGQFSQFDKYIVAYFGQPQSGWLEFNKQNMKRVDFLKALTKAKASSHKITLIPGETTQYFLYSLAKKYEKDYKDIYQYYLKHSPLKEGFLIPDTYNINASGDLKKFIFKFINHSKKIHNIRVKKFGLNNLEELEKILVIASIIEKESASKDEMDLVASVIFNRLKKGMKLQMDGTLNYGLFSHTKITAKRIRTDDSDYNTYKIKGLPKTPICNPSLEAIESAIAPAESDYLYFMKINGENRHIFSKTYKEHLKIVRSMK